MTALLSSSQIFIGLGLTVGLAIGCQVIASRFRLPAIILLLPAGFLAGAATSTVNPNKLFGSTFSALVSLAVAIILFDGGLDLEFRELEGHSQRVVRRLIYLAVTVTWAGAGGFAFLLLGLSAKAAVMLGAILIVSGPTVVAPLLRLAQPGRRLTTILGWEGTTIDPVGAIVGVLVFQAIKANVSFHVGRQLLTFLGNVGIGLLGGAIGTAVLWLLLRRMRLSGVLATQVTLGTVIVVAASCDALREDTGLVAAIAMGVALANLPGMDKPEDRPFFQTIVQLVIGLLFISISATVTPASLRGVVGPTLGLVACLVLVVRPLVAAAATARTTLSKSERAFIGLMDPRGIVAASTAATFAMPLTQAGIGGASKLLPATFIVIAGTVAIYGLGAVPAARALGLSEAEAED